MVAPTPSPHSSAPILAESGVGANADAGLGKSAPGHNGQSEYGILTPDKAITGKDKTEPTGKRRTGGWKFFDIVVYGVINFGGNVASAFWIANKMYDKEVLGQEFSGVGKLLVPFYAVGQFAKNKIFGPFFERNLQEKPAAQMTGMFSNVIALSWGGTLMLAPVKLLEDHKPKIVRAIDRGFDSIRKTFGGGPDEKELQERDQVYELLDSQQVKKTWAQAISARLFSVGVGVLGGLGLLILLDPKSKGIDRLATGYTEKISPHLRKVSWLRGMAPVAAPEMAIIENMGKETAFLASKCLTEGSEAAKTLLKSLKLSNGEANFLLSKGIDPTSEAAGKAMIDIHTRNKSAWNVSNLAVELSGSFITASMFYMKMMFEELFGDSKKKKREDAPAQGTAEAHKASSATTRQLAQSALSAAPETPATALDAQGAAQKKFTDTLARRDEPKIETREPSSRVASFAQSGMAAGVDKSRAESGLAHALT